MKIKISELPFSDALILYSICRANMREVANFPRFGEGTQIFPELEVASKLADANLFKAVCKRLLKFEFDLQND